MIFSGGDTHTPVKNSSKVSKLESDLLSVSKPTSSGGTIRPVRRLQQSTIDADKGSTWRVTHPNPQKPHPQDTRSKIKTRFKEAQAKLSRELPGRQGDYDRS